MAPVLAPQTRFTLFSYDPIETLDLRNPFFNSHLITYIGNKRRLLPFLYQEFLKVRRKIGKQKLRILDGFRGGGGGRGVSKSVRGGTPCK